jgi:AcrR family transcriptional regulator
MGAMVRSDVRRNRDALLAAAREEFAGRGLSAPLEHVARRAGLGIATLYRHFPSRVELVDALLTCAVRARIEVAGRALAMPDAWAGFAHYLTETCRLEAADRAVNDLMSVRLPESTAAEVAKTELYHLVGQLIARAQAAGRLREDLTAEDLCLVTWANARIIAATGEVAPGAWQRHVGFLLDAFRAEAAHELPVPALTQRQTHRAMSQLAVHYAGLPAAPTGN